jgi:hypothetical protein
MPEQLVICTSGAPPRPASHRERADRRRGNPLSPAPSFPE